MDNTSLLTDNDVNSQHLDDNDLVTQEKPIPQKTMRRILRIIKRTMNNERYHFLTEADIRQAMVDALHVGLSERFNYAWDFDVYWYKDENNEPAIKIEAIRIAQLQNADDSFEFNMELVGEFLLRFLLRRFQNFLDTAENKKLYNHIQYMKNGLVYGTIVRYVKKEDNEDNYNIISDYAVFEFYTDDGYLLYGQCSKRDLLPRSRDEYVLRRRDKVPLYIKNIVFNKNLNRVDILLSERSKRLPELILKQLMYEHDIDISSYRFKCTYRAVVKDKPNPLDHTMFTIIVTLEHRIPIELINEMKQILKDETFQVICIEDANLLAKFERHLIGFEHLEEVGGRLTHQKLEKINQYIGNSENKKEELSDIDKILTGYRKRL